jgi:hypothetical protein
MLLAVLYGRMWKVLDDDIKRFDMYYRLQKPNGTTGDRSLCLNYHTFWAPLSLFQALRYRHWSVAVSRLGNILATIIIPVFGNYVFYWEVYSGAALEWPDTYSWQVALVDHGWAYKLVGALASVEICCLVLFILLHSQRIGLSGDIRGIAGLMDLLEEFYAASLKLPSSSDSWSLSKMEEKFASSEFRLIKGKLKVTKVVEGPRSVTSNFYSSDLGKAISRVTQRVIKRCE